MNDRTTESLAVHCWPERVPAAKVALGEKDWGEKDWGEKYGAKGA